MRFMVWVAGIGVVALVVAHVVRRPVAELRVRQLTLVNPQGEEVAWLKATPSGAELVLGGASQASLVTDGEVAAANLVGEHGVARLVAGHEGHLVLLPEPVPELSPRCDGGSR